MAAPTRAASAPIAPATGAFLKAATERLDDAGAEVPGVEVPGVPVAEGVAEGAPLKMEAMGGVSRRCS